MPAQTVVLTNDTEVRVVLTDGTQFDEIIDVESDAGRWRFGVDRYRRPALLTTHDAEGNLADLEVPDWIDDVLARFDIRGVEA
jgi:hypothetical protein